MTNPTTDSLKRIRTHLEGQPIEALVELLLDLVREMEETTRRCFWARLAPPGLATADLRYPSADEYLAKLKAFAREVEKGKYYDEESQEDYDDYGYYDDYGDYDYDEDREGYDPTSHPVLPILEEHFLETESYFQAGHYPVAAAAYRILLDITLGDTVETLGIDDPLSYLNQDEHELVRRFLLSLRMTRPQKKFFAEALQFLAFYEEPEGQHNERFLASLSLDERQALLEFLETWADDLNRQKMHTFPFGVPFQLRLLLRLYAEAGRKEDEQALCVRFRKRYPALFVPLLADRMAAKDWQAVLTYGQEALKHAEVRLEPHFLAGDWPAPDQSKVRAQLARAFKATGEPEKAFDVYRPVFDNEPRFDTFAEARKLAASISTEQAQDFTAEVIAQLTKQNNLYLLCQILISQRDYDQAYAIIENLHPYQGLEVVKLVAKAHLLAALGFKPDPRMGTHLQALYTKVDEGGKETTRFLRKLPPRPEGLTRQAAVVRAETIYARLMQTHIDNGRKTYATAAYYCALLGEIAAYEGRLPAFKNFYEDLMERYKRYRALRSEMEAKVRPVLRSH